MLKEGFFLVKVKAKPSTYSVQFTAGKIAMNDAGTNTYNAKSHVRQDKTETRGLPSARE